MVLTKLCKIDKHVYRPVNVLSNWTHLILRLVVIHFRFLRTLKTPIINMILVAMFVFYHFWVSSVSTQKQTMNNQQA